MLKNWQVAHGTEIADADALARIPDVARALVQPKVARLRKRVPRTGSFTVDDDATRVADMRMMPFALVDEKEKGLAIGAKEFVLPSMRAWADTIRVCRLHFLPIQDATFAEETRVLAQTQQLGYLKAAVILNTHGSIDHHINPLREVYAQCKGFSFSDQKFSEVYAALPACCRKQDSSWELDNSLCPFLLNTAGTFAGLEEKATTEHIPEPKEENFMRLYEKMWPALCTAGADNEKKETNYSRHLRNKTYQGFHIFAIGYVEFIVAAHVEHPTVAPDRNYVTVWKEHRSALAVRAMPVVDIVVSNLPMLSSISYVLATAKHLSDFSAAPAEMLPLAPLLLFCESRADDEWVRKGWVGAQLFDSKTSSSEEKELAIASHAYLRSWFTNKDAPPGTLAVLYILYLFFNFMSLVQPLTLMEQVCEIPDWKELVRDGNKPDTEHLDARAKLLFEQMVPVQAVAGRDNLRDFIKRKFCGWTDNNRRLFMLDLPQFAPLVLASHLLFAMCGFQETFVQAVDELAQSPQNALSNYPKAVATTCLCGRWAHRLCVWFHTTYLVAAPSGNDVDDDDDASGLV